MTAPKRPQDRKPKATKPAGFTFEHDGTTYTLPAASDALLKIPGRALRDAMMDGTQGEMRLAFYCVEAVGADEAAVNALYDMPAPEMTEVILDWFRGAQLEGADLPKF